MAQKAKLLTLHEDLKEVAAHGCDELDCIVTTKFNFKKYNVVCTNGTMTGLIQCTVQRNILLGRHHTI